ncbi:MAG: 7TM-DISM domain-containing protein [Ramlibacter sp.]
MKQSRFAAFWRVGPGRRVVALAARAVLVLGCCLAVPLAWSAEVSVLPLPPLDTRVELPALMATQGLPVAQPVDPDLFWDSAPGEPVAPSAQWRTHAGERLVGRISLAPSPTPQTYVVQVPAAWLDEVQLWFREPGGAWQGAIAGDLVAMSRWPFAGQSPAFSLPVGPHPLDLMVMVANNSRSRVPVWLMADATFRENQLRQANLSGVIMGLGLMVLVVTVMGAVLLGRRANWLLAGVAAWLLLTVLCLNGYMAVWFTPQWPAFNDASKHFAGVMLVTLIVALTAEALDQRYLSRWERALKLGVPMAGLAYACAQVLWLPGAWRPPGALLSTVLVFGICMTMCALSALRGGRYVRMIAAAVACFGAGVVLVYTPFDFVGGLDLRAAIVGVLLFSSMLLYYQALFARERYGRDVLGRAAVAASRDPLTALLSYQGFEQAYDRALLRQGAGRGQTAVLLFLLPGLEQAGVDHGFVVTERLIVRFAACLQSVLGDAWSIARLNKTRFACIGTGAGGEDDLLALATQVLASFTRVSDPVVPVAGLDLRIACTQRLLGTAGLKALLVELDDAASAIRRPKRIVMV